MRLVLPGFYHVICKGFLQKTDIRLLNQPAPVPTTYHFGIFHRTSLDYHHITTPQKKQTPLQPYELFKLMKRQADEVFGVFPLFIGSKGEGVEWSLLIPSLKLTVRHGKIENPAC